MAATCSCGKANPDGAKFCLECGAPISRACGSCGIALPPDANFCLECGSPTGSAPDAPTRREIRKVVTIVFVDLAGSTSLQEHMDPESVRRVMERFYATMRSEVEAAGGLVVKFTGDGVMAGFGIRAAREDDALRAVRAGVAMQESFGAFAKEIREGRGADVSLRIGVNTGEVVVSDTDDDVLGDVVNVAARLEHAAGDGNILVGDQTWRLTRHDATFEAVAPLELKGKAEPVPAYRVVSLEAPAGEEGIAAPFVGRAAELRRLHEVFERCSSTPSPSIVTIVGSPGLGKSRLASQFVSSVSERATVLAARCEAAGTATYAPIAEGFRQAADIAETAAPDEVARSLEALMPDGFAERGRVAKLVASLLGIGEPATPQEAFWAVRRLLEGLAATQTVVLVVDDVQWAEPMLLDLLDHIVEWAKDAPILILALARPEIREVRPSIADGSAIVLEGLDPDNTAELAQCLLGAHDLPAALVQRILATTQGNPLFVRELLRMLVDDGVLHRDGERWVVTVEADEIEVPPTIHALLSARIERLREDERAVVEHASVVGQEFYRGAVMELVPAPVRGGVDGHLETLRRKELVEPEGSYWIDERVFRFHHVLIRDAAYRRLLKEARAELHERFADWLEAKVGDLVGEHEEVLGYHLEQACTYRTELGSLDDRLRDLGCRASAHLASAARRALDRDDLAAAANLSGRALALTEDDAVRASILLDRCEALLAMGDVHAAREAVSELRLRASDERLSAWADCFDGQLAILTDAVRLRETAQLVEDAARRLAELEDSAGAAKGHAVHAQALAHLGQFGACEAALDRALAAAREAGDRRRANAVLSSAPLAALWGPSPVPRASGRCLDVVRVLRITAGAPAVEATALRCQAVLEAMRGRCDAARRMLASARGTLEELGLRHALVECDMFAGLIDLLSGDTAGAEADLRSAYEGFRALNVGTDTAQAAALLARALLEQGRDDEALALTEESERFGGDDLKTAIAWRMVRARVLAKRGDVDTAVELARAAVAVAEPTDALVDHADARLALAEVLSAAGQREEAQVEARRGAELYARKEATGAESAPAATKIGAAVDGSPVQQSPGGVREAPWIEADLSMWERVRGAVISRDWEALAALLTPDFLYVDHRSGLRSELRGGEAFVDAARSMWQDIEHDWEIDVIGAWTRDIVLSRLRIFGEGWERVQLAVTIDRDGACCRLEHFDHDDYEAAFERLDELTYECATAKHAIDDYVATPNEHGWTEVVPVAASGTAAVVRAAGSLAVVHTKDGRVARIELFGSDDELGARRRLHELAPSPLYVSWLVRLHFDRHAHQDWQALRALSAPDVLVVDRRPVGWGAFSGVERMLEHLQEGARTASMAPGELWITQWLAIAPDRALFRYRWAGTAPDGVDFDFDRLLLMRIRTRDGLIVRSYMYDSDQIEDARRFMAGEDVSHRAAPGVDADLSIYDKARTAMLARDREVMLALHTPDHVFVDHRAGLQNEVSGPTEFLEGSARTYQGLESGRSIEILSSWTDDVLLSRSTSWGDGFEIRSLVVRMVRDGAWCRTEQFDADDYGSAFTRVDELAYQHSAAKQAIERYVSTNNEHGWTQVVPIVGAGNAALVRADESLAVVTTAGGGVTGVEVFEADDEFGARRRLHELAPSPSYPRWGAQQYVDAHNAQDWDAIRRLQDPTFVLDDRRPLGWERIGIEGMIEHFQEGIRSTRSLKVEIRDWISLTPNECGYILGWCGVTNEGAAFDYPRIVVYTCAPSGLGTRSVVFELDQMEEARTLLARGSIALGAGHTSVAELMFAEDDLAAARYSLDTIARPSHPVGTAFDRVARGYSARDPKAVADAYAADLIYVDHVHGETLDHAACVETIRRIIDSTVGDEVTWEPIVWLGSRHGVLRATWRWDRIEGRSGWSQLGAGQNTWALAVRVDREGRICVTEQFVPELMHKALARAEELYIEDEATGEAATGSRRRLQLWRMVAAHNEDDFDALSRSLASEVVFVDRRQLGWGTIQGRAEVMDVFQAVRYRSREHVWSVTDVHTIAADGCVYTHPFEGVDQDGGRYEGGRVVLAMLGDEGITRFELFSLDAVTEAVRRFEELRDQDDLDGAGAHLDATAGRAVPSVHTPPDGQFAEFGRRWQEAFAAGAGAELAALYSPDFEVIEHSNRVTLDRETHLDSMQQMAAQPNASTLVENILCLGARHGVNRTTFSWEQADGLGGRSEVSGVSAVRLDRNGLCPRFEWFPADQLHRALARAEELYIEDEATGDALMGAQRRLKLWRMTDAHNDGEWETFAQGWAPDVVFVDRRRLGWGVYEGREAVVDIVRAIRARSVRHIWSITEIHAIADDGCVHTLPAEGIDRDGGRYEQGGICVVLLTDEGVSRIEVFPFDAIDEALARFAQLRSGSILQSPPATVGEWFDRVLARLGRGDLQGYGALWTEDVVHEEKRPTLRSVATGRQAAMDSLLHVKDLAAMQLETEVIATRGDRHELRLVRYVGEDTEGGTFDVPILQLHVMNESGLVERATVYEPDDVQPATEELDERYAQTLPPGQAEIMRTLSTHMASYSGHDWAGYAATFARDVTVVDHRPAGWGVVSGIDHFMQHIRALIELLPDASVARSCIDRLTDHGVVAIVAVKGTDTNGGLVEFTYRAVIMVRSGKISVFELFPIEEEEAVDARFEELCSLEERDAATAGLRELTGPQTTMGRTWHRLIAAFNERDMGALRELFAPDFRVRDHNFHFELGRDGTLANFEVMLSGGSVVSSPGWALYLGDRHAVGCMEYSGYAGASGEIQVVNCNVARCDADGRYLVTESYAETDVIRALERAEELYLEDEATGDEAVWSRDRLRIWGSFLAFNEGDVSPFREWLQPDIVTIDHRPASLGELQGRDAWLGWLEQLTEAAPDRRWHVRSVQRERDIILLDMLTTGTNRDGGAFEIPLLVVTIVGGDRQEFFSPEQREDAERRFRELAQKPRSDAVREPSTHIERTWDRLMEALNEQDVDTLRELHAPGFRQRQVTWHIEVDLNEIIDRLEQVYAPPSRTRRGRSVILGDRHGLMEMVWSRPAGGTIGESENVSWIVFRFDEQGKILLTELYSFESDYLLALGRLEELYLEDVASGDEALWSEQRSGIWRTLRALNEGADPADLASRFPGEVVMIDRRPASAGELRGNDAWVAWQKELIEGTSDRRWEVRSVRLELNALWLEMAITGTNEGGGRIEIPFIRITRLGRGGVSELFAPEQREEAEQRLRELANARSDQRTDAATTLERAWARLLAAWNDRDIGAVGELLAPDYRCYEHMHHLEMDRDAVLADSERTWTVPGSVRSERTFLFGDRHGLVDFTWAGQADESFGASEVTVWRARRSDSDGRFVAVEVFAEDELLEALERTEELYLEDEARGDQAVWSRQRLENLWPLYRASNARDWDRVTALIPADFVTVDRRPGSLAEFPTRDGWLGWVRSMSELVRDSRYELRSARFDRNVVLLEITATGTNESGGTFTSPVLTVTVPGVRQEWFLPEQQEEAERRFHELAVSA